MVRLPRVRIRTLLGFIGLVALTLAAGRENFSLGVWVAITAFPAFSWTILTGARIQEFGQPPLTEWRWLGLFAITVMSVVMVQFLLAVCLLCIMAILGWD